MTKKKQNASPVHDINPGNALGLKERSLLMQLMGPELPGNTVLRRGGRHRPRLVRNKGIPS